MKLVDRETGDEFYPLFEQGGWVRVKRALIRYIIPHLKGAAVKVLLHLIDRTTVWEGAVEDYRLQPVRLSVRAIARDLSLSTTAVQQALVDLTAWQLVVRRSPGDRATAATYALNEAAWLRRAASGAGCSAPVAEPDTRDRARVVGSGTAAGDGRFQPQIADSLAEGRALWRRVLTQLALQMTRATFDAWLASSWLHARDEATLIVVVRNEAARDWLSSRLQSLVERSVAGAFGQSLAVAYVTAQEVPASRPHSPLRAPRGPVG